MAKPSTYRILYNHSIFFHCSNVTRGDQADVAPAVPAVHRSNSSTRDRIEKLIICRKEQTSDNAIVRL